MDHPNIWQCICKFLEPQEMLRLRILSSKHKEVSELVAKKLVPHIDCDEFLRQIFAWIIENVKMKAMHSTHQVYFNRDYCECSSASTGPNRKTSLAYDYDLFVENEHNLETYFDAFSEGEPVPPRLISENIELSDVLDLEYDLRIKNPAGPNYDKRGTAYTDVEIGDFHHIWKWKKGFWNVGNLADGYYRLKSHKFENWYEMVSGLSPSNAVTITRIGTTMFRTENTQKKKYHVVNYNANHPFSPLRHYRVNAAPSGGINNNIERILCRS